MILLAIKAITSFIARAGTFMRIFDHAVESNVFSNNAGRCMLPFSRGMHTYIST